jgi:hypothetical protein
MRTISMPRCPRCLDGGNVQRVEVATAAKSMFSPLPEGWQQREFRCECGWSEPADDGEREIPAP